MYFKISETVAANDVDLVVRTLEDHVRGLAKDVVRSEQQLIAFGIGPSPVVKNAKDRAVFHAIAVEAGTCVTVDVSYQASGMLGVVSQDDVVREKILGAFERTRMDLKFRSPEQVPPPPMKSGTRPVLVVPVAAEEKPIGPIGLIEPIGPVAPAAVVAAGVESAPLPVAAAEKPIEPIGPIGLIRPVAPAVVVTAGVGSARLPVLVETVAVAPAVVEAAKAFPVGVNGSEARPVAVERASAKSSEGERVVAQAAEAHPPRGAANDSAPWKVAGAGAARAEARVDWKADREALIESGELELANLRRVQKTLDESEEESKTGWGARLLVLVALIAVGSGAGLLMLHPDGMDWLVTRVREVESRLVIRVREVGSQLVIRVREVAPQLVDRVREVESKMVNPTQSGGAAAEPAAPAGAAEPAASAGDGAAEAVGGVGSAAKVEEQDLNAWLLNWAEAMESHDAAAQTAFYADPVDWYFRTPHVGHAALEKNLESALNADPESTLKIERLDIVRQTENSASVRLVKHFTSRSAKYASNEQRIIAHLKVKRIDGDWKIVEEHNLKSGTADSSR